jgi:hypothetical protein
MSTRTRSDSFDTFRANVDRLVSAIAGIGLDDLPDVPLMDWYDDGMSARAAATKAIRAARDEE